MQLVIKLAAVPDVIAETVASSALAQSGAIVGVPVGATVANVDSKIAKASTRAWVCKVMTRQCTRERQCTTCHVVKSTEVKKRVGAAGRYFFRANETRVHGVRAGDLAARRVHAMGNKQSARKSKVKGAGNTTKEDEALPSIGSMRRILAKEGASPGIPCMPELIEAAKGADTKDSFLAICNGVLDEHGVPAEPRGALLISIFDAVSPSNELSPQDAALCALCVLHLHSDFDDVADALFALMDEDNNGDLDVVELAMWAPPLLTILNPGARATFSNDDAGLAKFVSKHMDVADSNGDHMLDFDEFSAWFKRVCSDAAGDTSAVGTNAVATAGDASAADTTPPAEGEAGPPADEAAAVTAPDLAANAAVTPPGPPVIPLDAGAPRGAPTRGPSAMPRGELPPRGMMPRGPSGTPRGPLTPRGIPRGPPAMPIGAHGSTGRGPPSAAPPLTPRGIPRGPPAMPIGAYGSTGRGPPSAAPPSAESGLASVTPSAEAAARAPPPHPYANAPTRDSSADGWSTWDGAAAAGLEHARELLPIRDDHVVSTSLALAAATAEATIDEIAFVEHVMLTLQQSEHEGGEHEAERRRTLSSIFKRFDVAESGAVRKEDLAAGLVSLAQRSKVDAVSVAIFELYGIDAAAPTLSGGGLQLGEIDRFLRATLTFADGFVPVGGRKSDGAIAARAEQEARAVLCKLGKDPLQSSAGEGEGASL